MAPTDRYIIVSADGHAGGSHAQYREYLSADWQVEFDAWRGRYKNPFRDLQDDGRTRNWDSERRNADLDAEGIAAEVLFPNTSPPFYPSGALTSPGPRTSEEFERRFSAGRMARDYVRVYERLMDTPRRVAAPGWSAEAASHG